MGELKSQIKPFEISKTEVWEAYLKVKANQGAPGVDGCTIEEFERDLKGNLYKIWNRLVRREALRCIPGAAGRNSEGSFWVTQPT
ncbi:hypothetical protein ACJ6WF_34280 [Streptomyces sp. MMS24-I2-30]|uniref:hypothetical protein n=1 Tax=Streptomyces sp. MMS24-I2-30 TaxID=3351564 RepID=UPI003896BE27